MHSLSFIAALTFHLAVSSTAYAQAPAAVQVEFVQPEQFTDAGDSFNQVRPGTLKLLSNYLVKQAQSKLPAGQRLNIAITDIDLAGNFEPWNWQARDVRIVRDIYPPRIALRYTLQDADGTVLREGERVLRNAAFQMTVLGSSSDLVRYEKALLADWLASEFPLTQ
ncbi:DUF3016 domain-containing protein [Pseudomethylobacillus aquaticus]|uniref:DUF3016 domain-containing protein n=1 Tax=Pseudomethylobacillus aquaticus TaxID=2676064 RepID=A0A3N0V5D7_9PROT|nr:DUF3016 domain-containing protein [Pseudomethylobacillus aquaticus]ROH87923.1 DUF3016 domain-containing protein [Pseudomethylobacillus aquaticus]